MPIKVAIVEDDSRFRESLAVLIGGADGFCCAGSYPNAEVALKRIPEDWPDLILMDINLPKISGIQCVAKLKALKPTIQILMLTAHEDSELIFNSLKAGASGYLVKRTAFAKILEALADVHSGGSPISSTIARKVVRYFQEESSPYGPENLSLREIEILTHLSKGYQHKEIAELLSISPLTVRAHLRNIYDKLHVRTRTEAVVKFLGKA